MTKDEIKALVAAKIAGQGSAIDAASVLPAILNGIIDLIPVIVDSIPDITPFYNEEENKINITDASMRIKVQRAGALKIGDAVYYISNKTFGPEAEEKGLLVGQTYLNMFLYDANEDATENALEAVVLDDAGKGFKYAI